MAHEVIDIVTNINLTIDRSNDDIAATDFHLSGIAFKDRMPALTLVRSILQAFRSGDQKLVANNCKFVDIKPFISRGSHNLGHCIVVSCIDSPDARSNEAIGITLLAETIVIVSVITKLGNSSAIASTHIDDAVLVLSHGADHHL